MHYYMVSYDQSTPVEKYDALIDEIKARPTQLWAKVLLSCFIIGTNESTAQVYARLRQRLDSNNFFIVMKVCRPHHGWLQKEVHDWIDTHVPFR